MFNYAVTVNVPAAVPSAEDITTEALVEPSAVSLIVPPARAMDWAPIDSISSALVAALPAAIASENTNLVVPDPLAYTRVCGPLPDPLPWFPLVTASVGFPVTVTNSLYLTLTDRVIHQTYQQQL